MRFLFCMIVCLYLGHIEAQTFRTFSRAAFEQDFDHLVRNLERYENDGHNWLVSEHFQSHSNNARLLLQEGMNELAFFKLVSRLLEHTQQRHVRLGFSKRDPMYGDALGWNQKQSKMFPFQLKFIQGKAYIWENYSDDISILRGTEIVSINGEALSNIVDKLLPYIISDGQIQGSKYYDLSQKFMLYYFWYIDTSPEFDLMLIPPDNNRIHQKQLTAILYREIIRRKSHRYPTWHEEESPESVYTFHIDPHAQSATLRLKTFKISHFRKHHIDFRYLFHEIFTNIKHQNISQLILDVRDNPGGNFDCLFELLSYLLPSHNGAIKTSISTTGIPDAYKFPSTKPELFTGQLYVLINSGTFSAASELATFTKAYANAILIGEESAGLYDGYAAGYVYRFKLPNTGIRVWLPRINYEFDVPEQVEEDRGVLPDYEVIPTINDLIEGRDPQLLFTLDLIRK